MTLTSSHPLRHTVNHPRLGVPTRLITAHHSATINRLSFYPFTAKMPGKQSSTLGTEHERIEINGDSSVKVELESDSGFEAYLKNDTQSPRPSPPSSSAKARRGAADTHSTPSPSKRQKADRPTPRTSKKEKADIKPAAKSPATKGAGGGSGSGGGAIISAEVKAQLVSRAMEVAARHLPYEEIATEVRDPGSLHCTLAPEPLLRGRKSG